MVSKEGRFWALGESYWSVCVGGLIVGGGWRLEVMMARFVKS